MRYKAPSNLLEEKDEPLTQEDMQLGYDVAKYGIQQIKWDYGWWSDEIVTGQWRTNEGLLEVRNSAYLGVLKSAGCTTLKRFVSKANKAGVKLTLYILLKDTQLDQPGLPTSVGRNGHPEWFSNICITGVGNSADLDDRCFKRYTFQLRYLKNALSSTSSISAISSKRTELRRGAPTLSLSAVNPTRRTVTLPAETMFSTGVRSVSVSLLTISRKTSTDSVTNPAAPEGR